MGGYDAESLSSILAADETDAAGAKTDGKNRVDMVAASEEESGLAHYATSLSFFVNVLLLVAKLVAAIATNSIALLASALDSILGKCFF